jgi:hypothetical protein
MNIFLILALVLAALEALALQKNWFKLEVIAKPGVMVVLFIWLFTSVRVGGGIAVVRAGDPALAGW